MKLRGIAVGSVALGLTLFSVALAAETVPVPPVAASGPSFDCKQAQGRAEKLVCSDAELAAMDRELDALFQRALTQFPETQVAGLKASELGWARGRNDCWKADDVRGCVQRSYETRITELQIQTGLLTVPKAVAYACLGGESITAVFYSKTRVPSAVLTRVPDDQVIAYLVPSASGAKYEGGKVTFWQKGKDATVTWVDHRWSCSAR